MTKHGRECNEVDPGHGSASRPGMTKIVESKCRNRPLVCFGSNAVDSRQSADVRTVYFDDWLVGRATGKTKSPFTFSRRRAKSAQAFSVSGTLRLAAFVLPNGLKR
jgi:hypothetical protein